MTTPVESTPDSEAGETCAQPAHPEFWTVHVHGPDELVYFDTEDEAASYEAAIVDLTRGKLRPSSPFDPPITAHVIAPEQRPVVSSPVQVDGETDGVVRAVCSGGGPSRTPGKVLIEFQVGEGTTRQIGSEWLLRAIAGAS